MTSGAFPSLVAMRADHKKLLTGDRELTLERRKAILGFLTAGERTGAVLQLRTDRSAAQALLDYWVGVLYAAPPVQGQAPVPDVQLAPFDPASAPDLSDKHCPFRGLAAFVEDDADRYYGREESVKGLLEKVLHEPVVLVTGPSGSGKSSLVFAGLLPGLKGGPREGSGGWHYLPVVVPGNDPIGSLLRALCPPGRDARRWVDEHKPQVLAEPDRLRELAGPGALGRPIVLIVDQFEELFTLCEDHEERKAFAAGVIGLAGEPAGNRVVLTIREDFLRDVAQLPALKPVTEDPEARFVPPAMSARELRRVIELPAAMVGLTFDEGIVDDLVKEVVGEPTALPLLQFTLLRLWENRDRNRISWDTYRRVGSPREALKRTADTVYHQLPQGLDREVTRLIFRELVQPAVGVEFVRRRVRRESLRRLASSSTVDLVLARFLAAGLVRQTPGQDTDDDRIEVAHEALIRNWPLLSGWLEHDRDRLQQRLRLRAAAELSRDTGWDPGGLLSGPLLEEAQRHTDLDATEQEFVRRSQEAVRQAEREKEEARQRELEQAQRIAAAERERAEAQIRVARLWRWAGLLLLVMLLVTITAGTYAYFAQVSANARKDEAARKELAARGIELDAKEKERLALEKQRLALEKQLKLQEENRGLQAENKGLQDTLIALRARPALLVCKDHIDDFIPDIWKEPLEKKRKQISTVLRSTGKIQLVGDPHLPFAGSGFVVGKDVILTSTTVAINFIESDRMGGWRFRTTPDGHKIKASINFTSEKCGTPPAEYDILGAMYIDNTWSGGIALLRTAPLGPGHPPLSLAFSPPVSSKEMIGRLVYVVSYPAHDARVPPSVLDLILRGASGVKRLSPGKIIHIEASDRIGNDCTTMGGSSGGPLVDLETGQVIGISYAGVLKKVRENYGLPMWAILKSPDIRTIIDKARKEH
jgi:hypothetical protein